MHPHQLLDVEKRGKAIAVRFTGYVLDAETARFACGQLSRLVCESARPRLRLDLGGVGFLSAAAVGSLVALHRELAGVGGKLTLRNVRPAVYEIFRATRLTDLLDIRAAEEAAAAIP